MTAILFKDLLTLKQKIKSILLFLGIAVLYLYMFRIPALIFVLTCIFLLTNVTNLISFDKENNGLDFALALPTTRKQYVLEKYLLAMGTMVAGILFATLATYLFSLMGNINFALVDLSYGALAAILTCSIYCALTLPLTIKFTPQELRPIMITVVIVLVIVFNGGMMMFWRSNGPLQSVFAGIASLPLPVLALLALGISLILLFISYLFSMKVLNNKRLARK